MDNFKTELWKQFGAAIDMFENAISKCPDELWTYNYSTGKDTLHATHIDEIRSSYWYIAFHTLFFTDYYLDTDPDNFKMPAPFTIQEEDIDEVMPEKIYTKEELLAYVSHCRNKLQNLLKDMDEAKADLRWKNPWKDYSMIEITMYNMRHVMHHTGQMNMMLGKTSHDLPVWVSQAKVDL
ncbi:MAG: DinB family protein [Ignavibacteria bacterium]|nr:DinB family protein [Ignavibacteria bacterium]